jgi:group I intron endonuclease
MNKICCIYCIENRENGRKYVGQTMDYVKRARHHASNIRKGRFSNKEMTEDSIKFGPSAFKIYILIECAKNQDLLNALEVFFIKYLKTKIEDGGYNIRNGGGGAGHRGRKHSDETKKKLSKVAKGRPPSVENKDVDVSGIPKYTMPPESRQSLSERRMGSGNPMYGVEISEETREKLSISHSGERHWAYGRKMTEEERELARGAKQGTRGKNIKYTSKYVGVSYDKTRGPNRQWKAAIMHKDKTIHIGRYPTEEEAALAYNAKAIEIYGNMANINIIEQL